MAIICEFQERCGGRRSRNRNHVFFCKVKVFSEFSFFFGRETCLKSFHQCEWIVRRRIPRNQSMQLLHTFRKQYSPTKDTQIFGRKTMIRRVESKLTQDNGLCVRAGLHFLQRNICFRLKSSCKCHFQEKQEFFLNIFHLVWACTRIGGHPSPGTSLSSL